MYVYACMCIYTNLYKYIFTSSPIFSHVPSSPYKYIYIYTCMCTWYIYIYNSTPDTSRPTNLHTYSTIFCFFLLPLAIELLHTRNSFVVVSRTALKLYFSFAENSLFYRALLQKRRMILRSHELVCRSAYPIRNEIFESSFKTRTFLSPRCRKKRPWSFAVWAFERAFWKCHSKWDRLYGVATISRLLKIIGLFCRISSLV